MLTTPGSTTATRLTGSTSRILFSRVKARTREPSRATAPPESPVPAPRGVTGTPRRFAALTTSATSSVEPGTATARAAPFSMEPSYS